MALQTVEQARAAYREGQIAQHYSGPLHLDTTVSVSLLIALLSAMMLEEIGPVGRANRPSGGIAKVVTLRPIWSGPLTPFFQCDE